MVDVSGFTSDRARLVENASVVDGNIVGWDLFLKHYDNTTFNAGNVCGWRGIQGIAGKGIVICTSSTHPSSPHEGDMIYETNTDKTFFWDGSAWKAFYKGLGVIPRCKVKSSDPQAIPNGIWTAINYNVEVYDYDEMYSDNHKTRITAKTPGRYLFNGKLCLNNDNYDAGGFWTFLGLRKNGSGVDPSNEGRTSIPPSNIATYPSIRMQCSNDVDMEKDDYMELVCQHFATGTGNLYTGTSDTLNFCFSAVRISS